MNGIGNPGVLPPFTAIGLGNHPSAIANAYNSGIPSLGAFALSSGALGSTTSAALRGLSNVLLVSNLNEEVIFKIVLSNFLCSNLKIQMYKKNNLHPQCKLS